MFMDMDTRAVLAPLTKWNAVVNDARRIPELVRTAFREALSGRPGTGAPGHSARRAEHGPRVAGDEFEVPPMRYRTGGARPAADAVAAAAALLATAQRPLIVAGGGVVHAVRWKRCARSRRA